MTAPEPTKSFSELVREEDNSACTEVVYAFWWLQFAHDVLERNYRELTSVPDRITADRRLLAYDNHAARDALILEFVQRLHNYLASVKTLVDHTRAFRARHVVSTEFTASCDARLKDLSRTPVVKFLQDFRNPVLHSRLPRVSLTLTDTAKDGGLRHQFTLQVADLHDMHSWSAPARAYIDSSQEGYYADSRYVDLTAAAQQYQTVIRDFYQWFYGAVTDARSAAFQEFQTRRDAIIRTQAKLQTRQRD